MKYKEITEIAKAKKISIKDLTEAIGMTRQGLQGALDHERIELRKLKLLCEALRISPMSFFDNVNSTYIMAGGHIQNGNNNSLKIETKEREIELLKQQLEDKNEIIRLLRERK